MKKRLLAATLILALLTFGGVGAAADNISQIIGDGNTVIFVDVPSNHWAYNDIEYFASKGIINGVGGDKFAPNDGVTRESFCKMLVLTFNAPLQNPATPTFTDVTSTRWSYPYVEVCRNFLTGYASPFDSTMTFRPETPATREDIAVALVRMMGLTDADAKNPYAYQRFPDADQISPQLTGYVSVAVEQGLINGRNDGKFAPQASISRAETVTLLSRASKSTVTNVTAELKLETKVVYSTDGKDATLYVTAPKGTAVTVDGKSITMTTDDDNTATGTFLHSFVAEGTHTFQISGVKGGKTATATATAKYEIGAPVLSITQCPTSVTAKDVTIKGTLTDSKYDASLTINGESVNVDYYGSWSKDYTLLEGANKFTFVATNSAGKTVTQDKVINFSVGGPKLSITQCPTSVTAKDVTIKGTLTDSNYSVALTINGESVNVDYYGSWSKDYTLLEGANKFTFVATNSAGKTVTQDKVINFSVGGPKLSITQCPTSVTAKDVTIKGTLTDSNYSVALTINGESVNVDYYGSWSKDYTLLEGANKFTFVATNSAGKTVTQDKVINFSVGGPKLSITQCPTSVTAKDVTIKGTLTDNNYSVALTINGESVNVDYYGSWNKSYTLTEGENKFTLVATNEGGKSVTEERTVVFTVPLPRISFTQCPTNVSTPNITIKGTLSDDNYNASLTINGESVSVDYYGSWNKSFTLSEGENRFVFEAASDGGKVTTVEKVIIYTPAAS